MSTREQLPKQGLDIGARYTAFETELGFSVAYAGCWLPGIYQTFEAAEMAFQVSDEQLYILRDRANNSSRCITLYDIEQVLE